MNERLTPTEIVKELDKYIVGQQAAKRAVAIALRNRWRRQHVREDLRDEIHPKNILMIGPTGVGKTEIARRLAKIANAPFLKVEATKYTEVGYVGKDVESMIRDLVEIAVTMIKSQEKQKVLPRAKELAEERVLDLLVPPRPYSPPTSPHAVPVVDPEASTRERFRQMLRKGELDEREIQVDVTERGANIEVLAIPGLENMESNLQDMLSNLMPKRPKRRQLKVRDAMRVLEQEEAGKLVDMDRVIPQALELASQNGIIFLDEMDKIAEPAESYRGAGVSREGVQRDLLPLVEGSSVNTKYGVVKTDHILFIGAGAFYHTKPSDLFPELQGRFPIRVELQPLTMEDFIRILTEPENSLLKQYAALLQTEGVGLEFRDDAVRTLCELATLVNERTENIGARRLHTILEKVVEEVSFNGPDLKGQTIPITAEYVRSRVDELTKDKDLSRYIL